MRRPLRFSAAAVLQREPYRHEPYAYDAAGRLIATTDANGNLTTQRYDAAGNLIEETDGIRAQTAYVWDAFGRKIKGPGSNKIRR